MSDAVAIAIITGLTTAIPIIVTQYFTHRQTSAAIGAVKKQVDVVEMQGNSNAGEQLRIALVAAKALAESTPPGNPQHESNKSLAKAAQEKYDLHMATQAAIAKTKGN